MAQRVLFGAEHIHDLNRRMKGWDSVTENLLFEANKINFLIKKDKWKSADLKYINRFINDKAGFIFDYIFLVLNSHPEYKKYYKYRKFVEPQYSITEYADIVKKQNPAK
ncbi:MAG TPA: hypothetical protein VN704_05590 [Verrucomicrobiae bacterium]|nr:hypothetical protein [Verrucomicrobiae bacterium]